MTTMKPEECPGYETHEGEYVPLSDGPREFIAADIERIGFAAVATRYIENYPMRTGIRVYETWTDPDTGERMGRHHVRELK